STPGRRTAAARDPQCRSASKALSWVPNESTCALFAPPSKVYSHFFTYRCLPGLKHAAPRRLPRLGAGQGIPEAATLVPPLVLESIQSPADIRGLSRTELEELAGE